MLTIGSLFSGYGGIELGLEWSGNFRTIWHCEVEPYPCAILEERFPGIPNIGDITKVKWDEIERPDILCGGFPCQDISVAGKQKGIIKGETRSGLWGEFHKAIGILRPRIVLIENVSAITSNGLDIVLRDLAEIGYDAEWLDIRASDFGAPHRRERIFIVCYQTRSPKHPNTMRNGLPNQRHAEHNQRKPEQRSEPEHLRQDVPNTASKRSQHEKNEQELEGSRSNQLVTRKPRSPANVPNTNNRRDQPKKEEILTGRNTTSTSSNNLPNTNSRNVEAHRKPRSSSEIHSTRKNQPSKSSPLPNTSSERLQGQQQPIREQETQPEHGKHCGWKTQSPLRRMAYEPTKRLDTHIR